MQLYQNPHKMMQRGTDALKETKTIDQVRGMVRTAISQERNHRALMLGAACEKMAAKSEGASQAFQQVLGWMADIPSDSDLLTALMDIHPTIDDDKLRARIGALIFAARGGN